MFEPSRRQKFAFLALMLAVSLVSLSIWRHTKQTNERAGLPPFSFKTLEEFDDKLVKRMRILMSAESYSEDKLPLLFKWLTSHHLPKDELLFEIFVYVDAVPGNPPFKDPFYPSVGWAEEGKYTQVAWFEYNKGVGIKNGGERGWYVYAPDYKKTSLSDLKSASLDDPSK
jgi:hypothetical protein